MISACISNWARRTGNWKSRYETLLNLFSCSCRKEVMHMQRKWVARRWINVEATLFFKGQCCKIARIKFTSSASKNQCWSRLDTLATSVWLHQLIVLPLVWGRTTSWCSHTLVASVSRGCTWESIQTTQLRTPSGYQSCYSHGAGGAHDHVHVVFARKIELRGCVEARWHWQTNWTC